MDLKTSLLKRNKIINFITVITNLLAIILTAITIYFVKYKIVLTFSIVLISLLIILLGYLSNAFVRYKNNGFDVKEFKSWLCFDFIFFLIINVIGLGLVNFDFSNLIIIINLIISFVYLCVLYNYRNDISVE